MAHSHLQKVKCVAVKWKCHSTASEPFKPKNSSPEFIARHPGRIIWQSDASYIAFLFPLFSWQSKSLFVHLFNFGNKREQGGPWLVSEEFSECFFDLPPQVAPAGNDMDTSALVYVWHATVKALISINYIFQLYTQCTSSSKSDPLPWVHLSYGSQ